MAAATILCAQTSAPETAGDNAKASLDDMIHHPPKLSVSAEGTLQDIASALNKAMGEEAAVRANGAKSEHYTLDARNRSFWEICSLLEDQAPFAINGTNAGGLTLSPSLSGDGVRHFEQHGGVILFARSATFEMGAVRAPVPEGGVTVPAPPPTGAHFTFEFSAAVDPRVHVVKHSIRVTSITDENGNDLRKAAGSLETAASTSRGNVWGRSLYLRATDPLPKGVTIGCDVLFSAEEHGVDDLVIDAPAEKVNQSFSLGERRIRLQQFQRTDTGIAVRLADEKDDAVPSWKIVDGRGVAIASVPAGQNAINVRGQAAAAAPFQIVVSGARLKEYSIPMTLHDLPVP